MKFDHSRFGPDAGATLKANAAKLRSAFANGMRPPPRLDVAQWAERYRRFPDDDAFPGPWKHETAPELVEIMDALSPHDRCEEVALMKCAQSGGSASAENWIGYISDLHPGPVLFVQATAIAAKNWASEKFWPMVEATPRLAPESGGTIRPRLPDGTGSTTTKIMFARSGGYVLLAGANSAAGLRQRTVRYAVEDDLDQFPDDLDGQGSPESMVDARLKVWRSRGLSKRLKISTPTIEGASKIGSAYEASDRRRYHFKCPECAARFRPEWEDIQWPDGKPHEAYMAAPCCGSVIENWRKPAMKLPDGWLSEIIEGDEPPKVMTEEEFQDWRARMPRSAKRGFHLEGIISRFQSWADMATGFVEAQGDLNRLKTWTNLVRGALFALKGGQPDHDRLRELREQGWSLTKLPKGVLAVTLGGDVQGDGIYIELVGWGPNRESWTLDARFIPGETDVAGEGAWIALDEYSKRGVQWPGGVTLPIDQECIDAGYNTAAAQAYCALSDHRLPVFGRAGWTLPVIGRGEILRWAVQGGRTGKASQRAEDRAFIVGTYGVKLSWYGYLRATLGYRREHTEGQEGEQPRGLVHFGPDTPDEYFEQITSESIVSRKVNGHIRRSWGVMPGRQNHWLDCRVYAIAAAEKLMLDTLGDDDWNRLRVERHGEGAEEAKRIAEQLAATPKQGPASSGQGSWIDSGKDYF